MDDAGKQTSLLRQQLVNDARRCLRRDGYARIPREVFCLTTTELDNLRREFERLFDGVYDTGIYPDEIHWRRGISRPEATRELCNAWKASTTIAATVCSESIGRLACDLMEWDSCRMGQDDVIHKPPGGNAVGFHQDGVYISSNFIPRQNNSLTMWIALDEADELNGALQYAPGSHHWALPVSTIGGGSFHSDGEVTWDYTQSLQAPALAAGKDPAEVLSSLETVSVGAGEMIVHHQDVWHGSGPNASQRDRRALVAHVLHGSVEWADQATYIYGRYKLRGEPRPHEDFFPILSSRGGPGDSSKRSNVRLTTWTTATGDGTVSGS